MVLWIKMLWTEFLVMINWKARIKIKNTLKCDLKCPYCVVDIPGGRQADFEELTADEWIKIVINFPQKVGIVILIGGEPFCKPDAVDLINKLTDRGIIVKVLSNMTFKRMLDVKPTPFVKYLVTYHNHLNLNKWLLFLNKIKKKYRVKVFEVQVPGAKNDGQLIPGSEILPLVTDSDDRCYYRREWSFTPNGELHQCLMDMFKYRGHVPKRIWYTMDGNESYSLISLREKIEVAFLRNFRKDINNLAVKCHLKKSK